MNGIRDALRLLSLMAGAVGLLPQLALMAVIMAAILLAGAVAGTYRARPAPTPAPAAHSFPCPEGR